MPKIYVADFETTTQEEDCRVWAWCYTDIDTPEKYRVGNDILSFMHEIQTNGGIYYFHNLKFDGNFILFWLLTHGYKWSNVKKPDVGYFTTLISDMGVWYSIKIHMMPTKTGISNTIEIRDSLKVIPLPVEEIPKAYGLEEHKLKLDYTSSRQVGHKLTKHEEEYVSADVIIVAKALKFMIENGQRKMTAASNALEDFKSRYDKKVYNRLFPEINSIADADIRRSYKGGWTYLNPKYKNQLIGEGSVYDVNSMYPWAMKYCLLPHGEPVYFTGKYKKTSNYPLYVCCICCEFDLKPGKFPSVQLKHTGIYSDNEYIEHSEIPTVLTLTNIDYELFLHNYNIKGGEEGIEYLGGYMFRAKHGMFTEYIDYWYQVKTDSKRTGNKGMEKIAKLMLNSLYGKFGSRQSGKSKIPYYDNTKNCVRYKQSAEEKRKGGYLPIATFITSYCRDKIIRAAELCGDRFIYADTDSVHIKGYEPVEGLNVDEYRLGAFKLEEKFIRGKFIRQKTYLEVYKKGDKEKINLKCCGMPRKLQETVTEEDFKEEAVFDHNKNDRFAPKLMPKVVPGGVILKETTFQIKKSRSSEPLRVRIDSDNYVEVYPDYHIEEYCLPS